MAPNFPAASYAAWSTSVKRLWAWIRSGEANQKYSWHQEPQLSLLLPISGPTPVLLGLCQPCHAGRRHVIVIAGLAGRFPSGRLLFRGR